MYAPLFLLLLTTVLSAAQYSFTIHNNRHEGHFKRAVHTWLSFDGPAGTKYFNFIAMTTSSARGVRPALGKRTKPEKLLKRNSTETYTQDISYDQYTRMMREIDKFYGCFKFYSRYPRDSYDTYNDVTACHRILSAGGVHILDGIEDPPTVGEQIERVKSEQSQTS